MLVNESEMQSMTTMDNESFVMDAHNADPPESSNHHAHEPEERIDKHVFVSNSNGRTFSNQTNSAFDQSMLVNEPEMQSTLKDKQRSNNANCNLFLDTNFFNVKVRQTVCEPFPCLNKSGNEFARHKFDGLVKSAVHLLKKVTISVAPEKFASEPSKMSNMTCVIVKQMIHQNCPNRAFFQLLNRWAQKHKQDFLLDSFNTLVFLACNPEQSNQNLSPHLLLKSCDFTIKPPRGKNMKRSR